MTKKLPLSLAVGAYDHVRDIADGTVAVDGIELTAMHGNIEDLLYRAHNHAEWHVAELGMGGYTARLARGEQPYVAIPVFTSRVFRHSCIYVRKDSGIEKPQDLNGKRIGMPEWGMAAAVWARGMLTDHHGFDQHSVRWVQGGLHEPGRVDRSAPDPRLKLDYRSVEDRSLNDLLLTGELDALLSARTPQAMDLPDSPVKRLFGNLQEVEMAYWKETGILPMMHMIGIRRDVYEQHPWTAKQLYRAFDESKNRSLVRARDTAGSYFPVPLMLHAVQAAIAVGGHDFWPYGADANQASLAAFLRYAYEQGVTKRQLKVEEMFAPETYFSTRT